MFKFLSYIFLLIAFIVFIADLIRVAFLYDLLPFIKNNWKPTISLICLVIGISLIKLDKTLSKNFK